MQSSRLTLLLVALVLLVSAINLHLHRADLPVTLAGVDQQHLRKLNDSNTFVYEIPWVRPAPRAVGVLALLAVVSLAAVALAQRQWPHDEQATLPRAAGRALCLAAASLAVTEIGMQTYIRLQPSDYFGGAMLWKMRPNLKSSAMTVPLWTLSGPDHQVEEDVSNSQGLRERQIPLEKAPGELRIVCVGHSWTWGAFVSARHRWSNQLEALLQQRLPNRRVTVINAGMSGYTWLQAYLMLSRTALAYHPDLIIVGWLHDVDGIAPQIEERQDVVSGVRAVLETSAVYTVLRSTVGGGGSGRLPHDHYRDSLIELLAARGIPTLLFPSTGDPRVSPTSSVVSPPAWSLQSPICGWDQNPSAALMKKQAELMTGIDNEHKTHPNPAGHAIIATALADFLMSHPAMLGEPATTKP